VYVEVLPVDSTADSDSNVERWLIAVSIAVYLIDSVFVASLRCMIGLIGRVLVIVHVFVASLKKLVYIVFWIADNDWDVELCLIDSMIVDEPMVYDRRVHLTC
jgi:hypothetical protein